MEHDALEQEMIRKCQLGNQEAFRWLVQRYGDAAMRLAYLITRNHAQAEDALQEAMLAAWRAMPSFQNGRPFRPWLYRIVVNQCRMSARRKQLPTVPLDDGMQLLAEAGDDPAVLAGHHERNAALRAALDGLPEHQRQVVILHYFMDLSAAEIAHVLKWPAGTVKSRLSRALSSLRGALQYELSNQDIPL